MKKYLWLILLWATPLHAGVVSLTPDELVRVRDLVKTSPAAEDWSVSVQKFADKALGMPPHVIAHIQTAGKLKGSEEKEQTEQALKDFFRLKNLEWAFIFTGRKDYEQKAEELVLAWARYCEPPENPIDATNLETLIETYDLVRPDMAPEDRTIVDHWLQRVADTLWASDDPNKKNHINNWQAHRLKIIGMAAFVLGDKAMEQKVLGAFRDLMEANLNADGTTFDLLERDAFHYHVYDLEPMIRLAILFSRSQGLDLYHEKTGKDASIAACVAYLIPYAKGEKVHAEYVHTQVKFDLQRAQNHEKGHGIGEPFDPKAAQKCLELAQYYQPELKGLVGQLAGKSDDLYPSLQVLLNEVIRPVSSH